MISLLLLVAALADEPTATVDGGKVIGSAHLNVTPDKVIAALGDPAWEHRVSGSTTTSNVLAREGTCHNVAYVSPHPIFEANYDLRRCAVADGWSVTLLRSNAFSTYKARWKAVPEGTGSRLTYEVDLDTSLWFPDSLVRGEMKKSVLKMMKAIAGWSQGG